MINKPAILKTIAVVMVVSLSGILQLYAITIPELLSRNEVERQFALGQLVTMKPANKSVLLDDLIKALNSDEDWENRCMVVEAIGVIGGKKALNSLLDLMNKEEDRDVRKKAIEALGSMYNDKAADVIINAARDKDPKTREIAVWQLGLNKDPLYVPVLIDALRDPDKHVREQAKDSIVKYDDAGVSELIKLLDDENVFTRWEAEDALLTLKRYSEKELLETLWSENPYLRYRAYRLLQQINPGRDYSASITRTDGDEKALRQKAKDSFRITTDSGTIAMLLSSLDDRNMKKVNVIEALGIIGDKDDKQITSKIVAYLPSEDKRVSVEAAYALQSLGWQPSGMNEKLYFYSAIGAWDELYKIGEPLVELLIKMTNDPNRNVRALACETLGRLKSRRAIRYLVRALKDGDESVRRSAVNSLGRIADVATVSSLIGMLDDPNRDVKIEAIRALGQIKDVKTADSLVEFFKSNETDLRNEAVDSLASMGSAVLGALTPKLNDSNRNVRTYTARAIDMIKSGKVAIKRQEIKSDFEVFLGQLNDESSLEKRVLGANNLGKLGDRRASPYLIKVAKENNVDEELELAAISSLGMLGDSSVIDALANMMYVKSPRVRDAVARALVNIGKPVIETMTKKLDDPNRDVSYMAKRILEDVGGSDIAKTIVDKEDFDKILRNLKNLKVEVRLRAVAELAKLKNPKTVPFLIEALSGPDVTKELEKNIIMALINIGDLSGADTIAKYLGSQDSDLKSATASFFVSRGTSDLDVLAKTIESRDAATRMGVVSVLEKINDQSVGVLLLKTLSDLDPAITIKSIKTVGALKFTGAIDQLIGLLATTNDSVRKEATAALISIGEPVIDPLKPMLVDKNVNVKKSAEVIIAKVGGSDMLKSLTRPPKPVRDFDAMVKELESPDAKVRTKAIVDLGKFGDKRVVPYLTGIVDNDKSEDVKLAAIDALGMFIDEAAIPSLISQLGNKSDSIRTKSILALENIGAPVLEPLKPKLADQDANVKKSAEIIIAKVGGEDMLKSLTQPKTVVRDFDAIVKELKSPDAKVRLKAIADLGKLNDKRTTPYLTGILDTDKSGEVKLASIDALGMLMDESAIPSLILQLRNKDENIRAKTITALENIGQPVIEPLKPKLVDKDVNVKKSAELIIAKVGGEDMLKSLTQPKQVVRDFDAIVKELKSPDAKVRLKAIADLGKLNDKRTTPYLTGILDTDKSVEVKLASIDALGMLMDESAIPSLISQLRNKDENIRAKSVTALENIGQPVIEPLKPKLVDKDVNVKKSAELIIAKVGGEDMLKSLQPKQVVAIRDFDAMVKDLKSPDAKVRLKAIADLDKLADKRAVSYLAGVLDTDKSSEVKLAAIDALGMFMDESAIPSLISQLGSKDEGLRMKSITALENIGKPVIEPLKPKLADKDANMKKSAELIIAKVGGEDMLKSLTQPKQAVLVRDFDAMVKDLKSPDAKVRLKAIADLNKLADKRAVPYLTGVLDTDKASEVKLAAIDALGMFMDESAIPSLISQLGSKDEGLRTKSITALENIGKPVIEPLKPKLADKDTNVKKSAELIIAKVGGEDMLKSLTQPKQTVVVRDFDAMVKDLKSPDAKVRLKAIIDIGKLNDKRATPYLTGILSSDKSGEVKLAAIDTLGMLMDELAIPSLISQLGNKDENIRAKSVTALENIGQPVIEPLKPKLADKDANVKKSAEIVIAKVGGEDMLKSLTQPKQPVRDFDAMVKDLKSPDVNVRLKAITDLGKLNDKRATPYLTGILDTDKAEDVKLAAIDALGILKDEKSIPSLIAQLGNKDENLRTKSITALENIGKPVIEPLKPKLTDKDVNVKKSAELVIAKVGGEDMLRSLTQPKQVVAVRDFDAMVKDLKSPDAKVRLKAVTDLGKLNDKRATPYLTAMLDTEKAEDIKLAAIDALGLLKDEKSIPSLIAQLGSKDENIRAKTITALENIGQPVIEPLKPKLADKDVNVKKSAELIIAKVGGADMLKSLTQPKQVVAVRDFDAMVKDLKSPDAKVRMKAIADLGKLNDKRATPYLTGILDTEKAADVKLAVIDALGLLKDEKSIPSLISQLGNKDENSRMKSITALENIGKPVIESLKPKLTDKDVNVKKSAELIIAKVGGEDMLKSLTQPKQVVVIRDFDAMVKELKSSDAKVRLKAVTDLGKLNDKRATPYLTGIIGTDKVEEVKLAAVDALGLLKDIVSLIGQLGSNDESLRTKSISALESIGAPVIEPLKPKLVDKDVNVKKSAEQVITKVGGLDLLKSLEGIRDFDVMVRELKNPDAKVRLKAVTDLGKLNDKRATPYLAGIIDTDKAEEVKLAAIDALGLLNDITSLIVQLGNKDENVRVRTITTLENMGKPVIEPLKPRLVDKDINVKKSAEQIITKVGGLDLLKSLEGIRDFDVMVKELKSPDAKVRLKAVTDLSKLGDKRAVPYLDAMVDTEKAEDVKLAAIDALGLFKDEKSIPSLIAQLGSKDEPSRTKSINALENIGVPVIEPLKPKLVDKDVNVKKSAEQIIAKVGGTDLLKSLEGIRDFDVMVKELKSPDVRVRLKAIADLGKLNDKRATPYLTAILDTEKTDDIKAAVIDALILLKDEKSIPSLVAQLGTKSEIVRTKSVNALIAIGTPVIDPLKPKLVDKDVNVKKSAEQIIAKVGGIDLLKSLEGIRDFDVMVKELKSPDAKVRLKAIVDLGKLNDKRATPYFTAILDTEKADDIKTAVIDALGLLKDEKAIPSLITQLGSKSDIIRTKSVNVLENIGTPVIEPLKPKLVDKDINVKKSAEQIIAKVGGIDLLKSLEGIRDFDVMVKELKNPDSKVRLKAIVDLGKLNDKRATPYLAGIIGTDKVEEVKLAAVDALGLLKDIASLIGQLGSNDEALRTKSINSLENIGTPVIEPLKPRLMDKDIKVKKSAEQIITKVGGIDLLKSLEGIRDFDVMVKELKSPDAKVRLKAVIDLGKLNDKRATPYLAGIIDTDKAEEVKLAAIDALGQFKDEKSISSLIAQLGSKDEPSRTKSINALENIGVPVIEPLKPKLVDKDVNVKKSAEQIIAKVGGTDLLKSLEGIRDFDVMVKELKSPDAKVRLKAVTDLGKLNDKRATPYLTGILDTEKAEDVKLAAIDALGLLKDEKSIPSLIAQLGSKDEPSRTKSISALENIGAPVVEPLKLKLVDQDINVKKSAELIITKVSGLDLLKSLEGIRDFDVMVKELKSPDAKVRVKAVVDLGKLGDKRAMPYLTDILEKDKSVGVKLAAIEALGEIKDDRAIPAIIAELGNEDDDVRAKSIDELIVIGKPVIEPLKPKLVDKNANLKKSAETVILKLGGEDLLKSLKGIRDFDVMVKELKSPDVKVRLKAIADLGKLNDKRAVPYLINILDTEKAEDIKVAAIDALALLKDEKSALSLIAQLGNKSESIRAKSISALESIGMPVIEPLKPRLVDKDENVRKSAEIVILKLGGENLLNQAKGIKSIDALIQELKSQDVKTRINAANELAKREDKRVVPAFMSALEAADSNEDFKLVLVDLLGKKKDERALVSLIQLFNDKSQKIQQASVAAVADIGKAAIKPLAEKLKDTNKQVVLNTKAALDKLGVLEQVLKSSDKRSDLEKLMDDLKNKDINVRMKACAGLTKLADPRAINPLIDAFNTKDANENLQLAILGALAGFDSEKSLSFLIELLGNKNVNISSKASEIIVSKGDDVVDFLKKIYKTKPEAKKKVLTLFEKIKTKDAIAEIVRALDDKDNDTVVFAMKSLGRVKDHEALRSLLRFFYISDDKVRTVAINAVIGYGADAVKQLIPILDDKNVEASQSATIALQKINTKDAIDALNLKKDKKEMESFLNDLENVNPQIRWRAAEALGKLKKKASVEPLMKALKDTNDMVRIKSVESLGIIGDDRAVEAIAKLLDNDDIKTRVACSKALVKIGKPAVAYLKTKVDDKKTGEYAKEIIKEIGAGLPGTQKK